MRSKGKNTGPKRPPAPSPGGNTVCWHWRLNPSSSSLPPPRACGSPPGSSGAQEGVHRTHCLQASPSTHCPPQYPPQEPLVALPAGQLSAGRWAPARVTARVPSVQWGCGVSSTLNPFVTWSQGSPSPTDSPHCSLALLQAPRSSAQGAVGGKGREQRCPSPPTCRAPVPPAHAMKACPQGLQMPAPQNWKPRKSPEVLAP